LIQIIGRALRLHPNKKIANIILPFSCDIDEKNISNFLKVMAKNDSRIKKSFETKTLGGYISIDNINENIDEDNKDIEFKYNMIYNSFGILENQNELWHHKLNKVIEYIDKNNKIPSSKDKYKNTKQLGMWIRRQKENYNKNMYIMKEENTRKIWEEFINNEKYKNYFLTNENEWEEKLKQLKQYIDINKKTPSLYEKNTKQLGMWIGTQKRNYNKNMQIMKNENIRIQWEEFINDEKYKNYFQTNENEWKYKLKQLKQYIDINKKIPSKRNKNTKQLGMWFSIQKINCNKKMYIMKEENIRKLWEEFINDEKYKNYFLINENKWKDKLKQLKEYIDINKKTPSSKDKNTNTKQLGSWTLCQKTYYNKNMHMMKNKNTRNLWEEFINDEKYKIHFQTNENEWEEKLKQLKKYIDIHNKIPSSCDKNTKQLGSWISCQKFNYNKNIQIMKNKNIRIQWKEFINNEKYKNHFQTNENEWKDKLKQSKEYIDINKKNPSTCDKNANTKQLGNWILRQKTYYNKNIYIMKEENTRKLWEEFINDEKYNKYFK
jgi:hypothetical protein